MLFVRGGKFILESATRHDFRLPGAKGETKTADELKALFSEDPCGIYKGAKVKYQFSESRIKKKLRSSINKSKKAPQKMKN
jgi:hypothetical protein